VRTHSDPIDRWIARADHITDPSIVQPKKLSAERSSEVCGQCHAYAYPRDEEDWWRRGYTTSYRPSRSLDASRHLLTQELLLAREGPTLEAEVDSLYWRDGTMRVGGREYNAMILSPCFEKGVGDRKIACTSCHTMHRGNPDDQLGDALCVSCHVMPAEHTHHAPSSPASACVACHMPKTSYALFRAIRSHRIESPDVARSLASDRLPACNLCHLDRTLAWTAEKLSAWYGQRPVAVPQERVPAVVAWALSGDAAKRVLAADAMGDADALLASGSDWEGGILRELGRDPYAAVRFVAERSLRSVRSDRDLIPMDWVRMEIAHRDDRPVTIAE
jgi:predicted CXXCH cytochrome family protein